MTGSIPPRVEGDARHVGGEHAAGALEHARAVVDGERQRVEGDVADRLADVMPKACKQGCIRAG